MMDRRPLILHAATALALILTAGCGGATSSNGSRANATPSVTPTPAADVAQVQGTVTNADGEPVPNAIVKASANGQAATTKPDGSFVLSFAESVPCRLVTITVTAHGYGAWRTENTKVYPGQNHLDVGLASNTVDDKPVDTTVSDEDCRS